MTRSLFILTLLLHSCNSSNNEVVTKQDTISKTKNELQQASITLKGKTVDSNFLSFWKQFTGIVKMKNKQAFLKMSLETLECEQENININNFLKSYFSKVFDDTLLARFADNQKVDFVDATMDSSYFDPSVLRILKQGEHVIKEVNVTKFDNFEGGPVIFIFKFIETKNGLKFYGYDRVG